MNIKKPAINILTTGVFLSLTACSSIQTPSMDGVGAYFGRSDTVEVSSKYQPSPNAPQTKFAATMRMGKFVDERRGMDSRQIGTGGAKVTGLTRDEIVISQEVASYVSSVTRNRLDDSGYQASEDTSANALFELGASIKELTLNVKNRDEAKVAIEYVVKEVSTGKVVWSGLVLEKNDRFAGVSGNTRADIAGYLKKILWIVSGKAVTAITDSLASARPELFNMTPGVKPISGVTVYVSPTVAPAGGQPQATSGMPTSVVTPPVSAVPMPTYTPRASATSGLLLVNTQPARAKVYVDGVYFGLSPLRVEVDPGVHAVSVKLEGFKMATEKVSVRRGDNTEMDLTLER